MAFLDQPDEILKYLKQTWLTCDNSGISSAVIGEPLSPLLPTHCDHEPSSRQITRTMDRGHGGTTGQNRRNPTRHPGVTLSPEINISQPLSFKEREKNKKQDARVMVKATKTIAFKDQIANLPEEVVPNDMFVVADIKASQKVSQLSTMLRANREDSNPYKGYAKFNGEGHMGMVPTFSCTIYVPPVKPGVAREKIHVTVLRTATVKQYIGLILWKYYDKRMGPPQLLAGVNEYELRDVDDGEPDMDFPSLPPEALINTFGFDVLALCELAPTKKDNMATQPDFVRINVPKQGVSTLKLKSTNVPLSEILAMVQKKRALPLGQHTLELVSRPGVALDMDERLCDVGTNEFLLIHKYSKRFDSKDDIDKAKDKEVENSLRIYQYELYIVFRKVNPLNIFAAKEEVMLNVDGEKLSVIPYYSSSTFARPKNKLVTYAMDSVVHCEIVEDRANSKSFKFVVPSKSSNEYKSFEFEAKDNEEAAPKQFKALIPFELQRRSNYYSQSPRELVCVPSIKPLPL